MKKGDFVILRSTPRRESACAIGRLGEVMSIGDLNGTFAVKFEWDEWARDLQGRDVAVPRRMDVYCNDEMVTICGVS